LVGGGRKTMVTQGAKIVNTALIVVDHCYQNNIFLNHHQR